MTDSAVSPGPGLPVIEPRRPSPPGRHAARHVPTAGAREESAVRVARLAWSGVLVAVLGTSAAVRWADLRDRPGNAAEALTVGQTFALDRLGELSRPVFGPGTGPLGRLQLGAYTDLTLAFDRYDDAVVAVREPVVLAAVLAAALVWGLARKLGMSRVAAAVATAILVVSPLAVDLQRLAVVENLAVCWLLGALLVAAAPRGAPVAGARRFAVAVLLLAVAVLTSPVAVLAAPAVVWLGVRGGGSRDGAVRALRTVALLAAAVTGALAAGLLVATGPGPLVDLPDGLAGVPSGWLAVDPALPVLGTLAVLGGLYSERLRPIAVGTALLAAGGLVVGAVSLALPLAALLIAGVTEEALAAHRTALHRRGRVATGSRLPARLATALIVVAALATGPVWARGWVALSAGDSSTPAKQARQWLTHQVPGDGRVLADGAAWAELVRDGHPAQQVLRPASCGSGCVPQWLLSTAALRSVPTAVPALRASLPVAVFGTGSARVEVRRSGTDPVSAAELRARARAGEALAGSARVAADDGVRSLLRTGHVDPRVLTALATLVVEDTVWVLALPAVPGEDAADQPRRQLLLAVPPARDGAVDRFFAAQIGPYRPAAVTPTPTGVLVRYAPLAPAGLLDPFS